MHHAIFTLDFKGLAKVLNEQTQKLSESSEINVDFLSPFYYATKCSRQSEIFIKSPVQHAAQQKLELLLS